MPARNADSSRLTLDDWSYRHVWSLTLASYAIGLGLARKRYA